MPDVWKQGEHLAIVGDTGSGKTFLESRLLAMRDFTVVFRTKSDRTKIDGHERIKLAKQMHGGASRYLLEPKYEQQAYQIWEALETIWREGGWTVGADELFYIEDRLGLRSSMDRLWTQGRSKNITILAGMQRPVAVSRFALSQCTHLFCFLSEGRDVKTIKDAFSESVAAVIPTLRRYEFAYYNRTSRTVARGYAQTLDQVLVKG